MEAGERDAAVRTVARDGDLDRYVSALFAPRRCREHLFALYAFNVELARIGEQVSEPQLGEIRLQWWRDALDRASSGETTGQPVADALGLAVRECDLSRQSLTDLIDARRFDVSVKIMPDKAALDDYLAKTAGALFKLASEVCMTGGGAGDARALGEAVRAAGIAYGLTGLMRGLPIHARRGRIDFPEDALLRHGTSPAKLLAGEASEGLTELLADLRETARAALKSASQHVAELPPAARPAFLPLALVDPYLSVLQKVDPLHRVADINPLTRLWRLRTWRFRASA
ncbi:MAG TPA: phytoene/squalene synthase family protein [Methyloceanibacter sp.]|nr:phytoene/squalene synthase family protein [Methyloceanibacter sp.]